MYRFPYKVWLYWSKSGYDCIVNHDYRRVNKRSFKRRNKNREDLIKHLKSIKDLEGGIYFGS